MLSAALESRVRNSFTIVMTVDGLGDALGRALYEVPRSTFPLLSGVDPFGDTFFNATQCGALVEEMARLKALQPDEDRRKALERVISLADRANLKPHHFIVFRGD